MADTNTNAESWALYRHMCRKIVGTDNHIKTIRLLNNVRDDVMSNKRLVTITGGSFGEGLDVRGSDLDMIYVIKTVEVYEDEKTDGQFDRNVTYYKMETDDVKHGFTHLLLEKNVTNTSLGDCHKIYNGKHYLSSALFRTRLLGKGIIHGPCFSDEEGFLDQCFCFHCKTWISQATHWITRSDNSWPGYNVKQSIIKNGVLIVAKEKRSPDNYVKEDIEWQISFSLIEKLLVRTFTHTQLLCYALLKIHLKDVLDTFERCEHRFSSYIMKTIMLWISEELPQSVWKPDNLIPCFMRCFNRLIYCVEYSVCFHYFNPEHNMFDDRRRDRKIILDRLYTLHSYGWRCILFSDQLFNWYLSMRIDHLEPDTLHTIEVAQTLNSKLLMVSNQLNVVNFERGTHVNKKGIRQIVSYDQSSLKYLYIHYISLWCARKAQTIPLTSPRRSIKHQYKQYNSCCCTLLHNVYHDAVSGWLMLASFFYKTKQYSKALHIIEYSLSKCTHEKLNRFMDMSDLHYQLIKLKSIQKKSLVRLWKIMLVDFMNFGKNSWLIPNELQMELENRESCIPSIVYAYFLQFLCYYHLNNVRQCQKCLHTLQRVIAEHYLMEKDTSLQSGAYNILGIAFHLSGDREAASLALMQSVEIHPHHRYNSSIERISLMN